MPRPTAKRRGEFRREMFDTDEDRDDCDSNGESNQGGFRKMSNKGNLAAEKAGLREVNSKYLGDLVQHDDESYACLETNEDRLGDEIRYKAEAHY